MSVGDPNVLPGRTTSDETFGPTSRRRPAADDPLRSRSEDLIRLIKVMDHAPGGRAVHLLRTTIRRVETLLPEAASGAARKLRKQLDRLRRRAGKVRDVDVHREALRALPTALDAAGHAALREALAAARQKREKRLVRVVARERDRGLVKRLRQVVAGATGGEGAERDPARVVAQVLADFEQACAAAVPLSAANLHDFRIGTKHLRYRVEPFAADPAAAVTVRELKRVQDAIGTWHDWLTLGERTAHELASDASPLLAAVRARTERELAKALDVIERAARRLQKVRPMGARKGQKPVTADGAQVSRPRAGASA
jgi:CHAD domain-containing protein